MGARPRTPQTARHAGPRHIGPIVHTIKLIQFESSWPRLSRPLSHSTGAGEAGPCVRTNHDRMIESRTTTARAALHNHRARVQGSDVYSGTIPCTRIPVMNEPLPFGKRDHRVGLVRPNVVREFGLVRIASPSSTISASKVFFIDLSRFAIRLFFSGLAALSSSTFFFAAAMVAG